MKTELFKQRRLEEKNKDKNNLVRLCMEHLGEEVNFEYFKYVFSSWFRVEFMLTLMNNLFKHYI